jgi:hypothetical protein
MRPRLEAESGELSRARERKAAWRMMTDLEEEQMADKTPKENRRKSKASGQGRKENVKGSGVYPVSGPLPPGDAEIKGQAEWGQGERGAAGYEDHGDSEAMTLPPESEEPQSDTSATKETSNKTS